MHGKRRTVFCFIGKMDQVIAMHYETFSNDILSLIEVILYLD